MAVKRLTAWMAHNSTLLTSDSNEILVVGWHFVAASPGRGARRLQEALRSSRCVTRWPTPADRSKMFVQVYGPLLVGRIRAAIIHRYDSTPTPRAVDASRAHLRREPLIQQQTSRATLLRQYRSSRQVQCSGCLTQIETGNAASLRLNDTNARRLALAGTH